MVQPLNVGGVGQVQRGQDLAGVDDALVGAFHDLPGHRGALGVIGREQGRGGRARHDVSDLPGQVVGVLD